MHDQIKVLDIEKQNDHFRVVFEVPGHHYDQPYPKRLNHVFPLRQRFFKKVEFENGEKGYNFEKYLVDQYIDTETDKKRKQKAEEQLDQTIENLRGKEYAKEMSKDHKK